MAIWTPLAGRLAVLALLVWTGGLATGSGRRPELASAELRGLRKELERRRASADHAGALRIIRRILLAYPDSHMDLWDAADLHYEVKDYAAEAEDMEQYVGAAPYPTDACPRLGEAYARFGDAPRALDAHRRCLAMDPARADFAVSLALALEESGQAVEAEELYRRTLGRVPAHRDATLGLARLLLRRSEFGEAASLIERALKASPGDSELARARGLAKKLAAGGS